MYIKNMCIHICILYTLFKMSQWNSALFNCFYKTVEYSNDGTSGCEFYMFVAMASYYGKGQNTV